MNVSRHEQPAKSFFERDDFSLEKVQSRLQSGGKTPSSSSDGGYQGVKISPVPASLHLGFLVGSRESCSSSSFSEFEKQRRKELRGLQELPGLDEFAAKVRRLPPFKRLGVTVEAAWPLARRVPVEWFVQRFRLKDAERLLRVVHGFEYLTSLHADKDRCDGFAARVASLTFHQDTGQLLELRLSVHFGSLTAELVRRVLERVMADSRNQQRAQSSMRELAEMLGDAERDFTQLLVLAAQCLNSSGEDQFAQIIGLSAVPRGEEGGKLGVELYKAAVELFCEKSAAELVEHYEDYRADHRTRMLTLVEVPSSSPQELATEIPTTVPSSSDQSVAAEQIAAVRAWQLEEVWQQRQRDQFGRWSGSELTDEQMQQLREEFRAIDTDGNGRIEHKELEDWTKASPVSSMLRQHWSAIDGDQDGHITLQEIRAAYMKFAEKEDWQSWGEQLEERLASREQPPLHKDAEKWATWASRLTSVKQAPPGEATVRRWSSAAESGRSPGWEAHCRVLKAKLESDDKTKVDEELLLRLEECDEMMSLQFLWLPERPQRDLEWKAQLLPQLILLGIVRFLKVWSIFPIKKRKSEVSIAGAGLVEWTHYVDPPGGPFRCFSLDGWKKLQGRDQEAQVHSASIDNRAYRSQGCGQSSFEHRSPSRHQRSAGRQRLSESSLVGYGSPVRGGVVRALDFDDQRSLHTDDSPRTPQRGPTLLSARSRSINHMAGPEEYFDPGSSSQSPKKARWHFKDNIKLLGSFPMLVGDSDGQQDVATYPCALVFASQQERMELLGSIKPSGLAAGDHRRDGAAVAAIQALARYPNLVRRVFANNKRSPQAFADEPYRLLLYKPDDNFGRQHEIEIDDTIPCINRGGVLRPFYATSLKPELWGILLEKGVAKVLGGYRWLCRVEAPVVWAVLLGAQRMKVFFRRSSEEAQFEQVPVWGKGEFADLVDKPCAYEYSWEKIHSDTVWEDICRDNRLVVFNVRQGGEVPVRSLAVSGFEETGNQRFVKFRTSYDDMNSGVDGEMRWPWNSLVPMVEDILFCDAGDAAVADAGPSLSLARSASNLRLHAPASSGSRASASAHSASHRSGSSGSGSCYGRGATPPPPAAPGLPPARPAHRSQWSRAQYGDRTMNGGTSSSRSDLTSEDGAPYKTRPNVPKIKFPWQRSGATPTAVVNQSYSTVATSTEHHWSPQCGTETPQSHLVGATDVWCGVVGDEVARLQPRGAYQRDGMSDEELESFVGKQVKYVSAWKLPEFVSAREGGRQFAGSTGSAQVCDVIDPTKLVRGRIDDRWLHAAVGALAEWPNAIESLFSGCKKETGTAWFRIPLRDPGRSFQDSIVEINDRVPVYIRQDGSWRHCFLGALQSDPWPTLLAKAVGKLLGGWSQVTGYPPATGYSPAFGLALLTGQTSYKVAFPWSDSRQGEWGEGAFGDLMQYPNKYTFASRKENNHSPMDLWHRLRQLHEDGHVVICCFSRSASPGQGGPQQLGGAAWQQQKQDAGDGLLADHWYTLVNVADISKQRVLQFRNMYGSAHKWRGAWSYESTMWEKYPQACEKLGTPQQQQAKSTFCMDFQDVVLRYREIYYSTTSFDEHFGKMKAKEHHLQYSMAAPLSEQRCLAHWKLGPDLWHDLHCTDPDTIQKGLSSWRDGISDQTLQWPGHIVRWVSCSRLHRLMQYDEQRRLSEFTDAEVNACDYAWKSLTSRSQCAMSVVCGSLYGGLADGGIHGGITQAAPGSCWLVAAIASLVGSSVLKDAFQQCPQQPHENKDGPYALVLYSPAKSFSKEVVQMNDRVPCYPRFSNHRDRPSGWGPCFTTAFLGEMWPHLLEKGVAHLVGGYSKFTEKGCSPPLAWGVLTGQTQYGLYFTWDPPAPPARGSEVAATGNPTARWGIGSMDLKQDTEQYSFQPRWKNEISGSQVFDNLLEKAAVGKAIACTFRGDLAGYNDDDEMDGLVPDQAYAVLQVKKILTREARRPQKQSEHKLLQLYSPIRDLATKWRGAWSDQSAEWQSHPDLARELQYVPEQAQTAYFATGCFWMSFADFERRAKEIFFSKEGFHRPAAPMGSPGLCGACTISPPWAVAATAPSAAASRRSPLAAAALGLTPPPPAPILPMGQSWLLPAALPSQAAVSPLSTGFGFQHGGSFSSSESAVPGLEDVASSLGRKLDTHVLGGTKARFGPSPGNFAEDEDSVLEDSDANAVSLPPGKYGAKASSSHRAGSSAASSSQGSELSDFGDIAPAQYRATVWLVSNDSPWKSFQKYVQVVTGIRRTALELMKPERQTDEGGWRVVFQVSDVANVERLDAMMNSLRNPPLESVFNRVEITRHEPMAYVDGQRVQMQAGSLRAQSLRGGGRSPAAQHRGRGAGADPCAQLLFREVDPIIRAHIDLEDPNGLLLSSRADLDRALKEAVVEHLRDIFPAITSGAVEVGAALGSRATTYGRGTTFTVHFSIDGSILPGANLQDMRKLQERLWTFGATASSGSGSSGASTPKFFRQFTFSSGSCMIAASLARQTAMGVTGGALVLGTKLGTRLYVSVGVDSPGSLALSQFSNDKVMRWVRHVEEACGGPVLLTEITNSEKSGNGRCRLHFEVYKDGSSVEHLRQCTQRLQKRADARVDFAVSCDGQSNQSLQSSSSSICAHLDIDDVTGSSSDRAAAASEAIRQALPALAREFLGASVEVDPVIVRPRREERSEGHEITQRMGAHQGHADGAVALTVDFKVHVNITPKAERRSTLQKLFNFLNMPEIHRDQRVSDLALFRRFRVEGCARMCACGLCDTSQAGLATIPRSLGPSQQVLVAGLMLADVPGVLEQSNASSLPRLLTDVLCAVLGVSAAQVTILHVKQRALQALAGGASARLVCFELRVPDGGNASQELQRVLRNLWGMHRQVVQRQWHMLPFFRRFSIAAPPYVDCQSSSPLLPASWHSCRVAEVRAHVDFMDRSPRRKQVAPDFLSEMVVKALEAAADIPAHRVTVTAVRARCISVPEAKDLAALDQSMRSSERKDADKLSGHDDGDAMQRAVGESSRWCYTVAFEIGADLRRLGSSSSSEEKAARQIAGDMEDVCKRLRKLHSDAVHLQHHKLPFFKNFVFDAGPLLENSPHAENDAISVAPLSQPPVAMTFLPSPGVQAGILRGRIDVLRRPQCAERDLQHSLPDALARQFTEAMCSWLRGNVQDGIDGFSVGSPLDGLYDADFALAVLGVSEKRAQRYMPSRAYSDGIAPGSTAETTQQDAYCLDFEVRNLSGSNDALRHLESRIYSFTALAHCREWKKMSRSASPYGRFFQCFSFDRGVQIDFASPVMSSDGKLLESRASGSSIPGKLEASVLLRKLEKAATSRSEQRGSDGEAIAQGIAATFGVCKSEVTEVQADPRPDGTVSVRFQLLTATHRPATTAMTAFRAKLAAVEAGSELYAALAAEPFGGLYSPVCANEVCHADSPRRTHRRESITSESSADGHQIMMGEDGLTAPVVSRMRSSHSRSAHHRLSSVISGAPDDDISHWTTEDLFYWSAFWAQAPQRDPGNFATESPSLVFCALLQEAHERVKDEYAAQGAWQEHSPYVRNRLLWSLFYFLEHHIAGRNFNDSTLMDGSSKDSQAFHAICDFVRSLCSEEVLEHQAFKEMPPSAYQVVNARRIPEDPEALLMQSQAVRIAASSSSGCLVHEPAQNPFIGAQQLSLREHAATSENSLWSVESITSGNSRSTSSGSIWVRLRSPSGKYLAAEDQHGSDEHRNLKVVDSPGPESLWMMTRPPKERLKDEVVISNRSGWLLTQEAGQRVVLASGLQPGQQRWRLLPTASRRPVAQYADVELLKLMGEDYGPADVCQLFGGPALLLDIARCTIEACEVSIRRASRPNAREELATGDAIEKLLNHCIDALTAVIRMPANVLAHDQDSHSAIAGPSSPRSLARHRPLEVLHDFSRRLLHILQEALRFPVGSRDLMREAAEVSMSLLLEKVSPSILQDVLASLLELAGRVETHEANCEFLRVLRDHRLRVPADFQWPNPDNEEPGRILTCLERLQRIFPRHGRA